MSESNGKGRLNWRRHDRELRTDTLTSLREQQRRSREKRYLRDVLVGGFAVGVCFGFLLGLFFGTLLTTIAKQ